MRVLHVIAGLPKSAGGPSESVPRLCSALARGGAEVSLATLDGPLSEAALACRDEGVDLRTYSAPWKRVACYSRAISKGIKQLAKDADLVHGHGLWLYTNRVTAKWARRLEKPLVISLRGMLMPEPLKISSWKKRLAMDLYERRDLNRAACLHALTEAEHHGFRALNLTNPTAVLPSGIELSSFERIPGRGWMEKLFPDLKGRRLLLFLGRIHPIKGLAHTLRAWGSVAAQFPGWDLVVAGWNQGGHEDQMKTLATSLGVARRVHFVGKAEGEKKYALFGHSEIFILSSFSEAFSMAILEAMASRLPVLLTPGCNFPEAVQAKAAVSVDPNDASTAAGLNKVLSMSDEGRREMGERGRALVEQDYTWDRIAAKMLETYEWVLGQKPRPEWVKEI